MEIIYDLAVVTVVFYILAIPIESLNSRKQHFLECLPDRLMHIKMIDSNARLPTVKELTKQHPHGSAL